MAVDVPSVGPALEEEFRQGPPPAWTARCGGSPARLAFVTSPEGSTAQLATDGPDTVVFDGVLHDRDELVRRLPGVSPEAADAEIVLRVLRQFGSDWLRNLRGSFALVLHDADRGELRLARDPLGAHSLFYARTDSGLFVSPSTNALVLEPAVSGRVNRALLADNFCRRWSVPDETYYEAVKRVPSGHVVRVRGDSLEATRYWDPSPPGEPVNWASDDEVDSFDDLLDRAIDRWLDFGPAAIYLSGGLDSVSVAAVAGDRTRLRGMAPPLALSLAFPDPQSNEEATQRAVASKLGLTQIMLSIDELTKHDGLLPTVLDLSSKRGAPIIGCWLPGYRHLGLRAKDAGCSTIFTGAGGDEWLGVTFYLAADLLRSFDLAGWTRLARIVRRSFNSGRADFARNLLWTFGLRPIVRAEAIRALKATAPGVLRRRRRKLASDGMPDWVAADPALREQLLVRVEEGMGDREWERSRSFYLQQGRLSLDHAIVSMEMEELFENGRHLGVRTAQPYWDPDLVDLLYRIPPDVLSRGGRAKGLVRETLARRFPDLGLERQKKVIATDYFTSVMLGQGREIWEKTGGAQALAELGVVDGARVHQAAERMFSSGTPRAANGIWNILNLEAWVRPRI
jgi:asparagine synthetase B (glutamine-hydrolysing)